jgi:lipopolysaccharide biosynthesis regulator YciM
VDLLGRLFRWKKDSQFLYTEALECLLQGETNDAFTKLRELVRQDTENVQAYLKLGDIFRERSQTDQAIKIHQSLTFRRRLSSSVKREIYASLAKDYSASGRYDRSEEHANRVLKLDKKNRWALEFLIDISEKQEKWEKASKYLHRLEKVTREERSKRHAFYILMQGRDREEDGLVQEAKGFYNKAISADDSFADAYLYLGNLAEDEGNLDEAVAQWTTFAEKSAGGGRQIYGRLEKALFELGRFGETEEFYRELSEKDSSNMDAFSGLINVLAAKGEFDEGIAIVDDLTD